jgi:Na+/proline symporter
MVMLSSLDFILIGVYFVVLLVIGYFSSRRQKEEDFLIAERKLGTWSTMATINASKSGSILMIFVALTYLWGFAAIWYFIGVVFGTMLFIPFALRLKENSKKRFYTLADYFKFNYGKGPAAIASLISIFLMFGFLVLNLMAGTKLFVFFSGWSFWLCATIMMFVILAYLLMGGFKAVVKTDILQYIAMIFILVLLTIILFSGSLIPASEWSFFDVDVMTLVGFFVVGIIFPFASPDLWQRVYSSRGKKQLKRGMLLSVLFYAFMAFLLALVALTVKVKFPSVDPDLALIYGFANLLPVGLLGLGVILLFAAIMSSIDTYIFTAASSVVQDFFNWDKEKIVRGMRKLIFVLAVVATLVSIWIQSLIIGSYIFVAAEVVLGAVVVASWIKRGIGSKTIMFGLVVGLIGFFGYLIMSLSKGSIEIGIVIITLIATLIGLGIGAVVSVLRK